MATSDRRPLAPWVNPFLLAPMAGYTELPFRRICRRYGAGAVFTELVSVDGIVRGSPSTWHLLATDPSEQPVGVNLYGSDPETFAAAVSMLVERTPLRWVDINAGCPVPQIIRRGAGAGLVETPERLAAIVSKVRSITQGPVTVKSRPGIRPDRIRIFEIAAALEEAGATALTIHARTVDQRHAGAADWDLTAEVRRRCQQLLIVGNGGLTSPAQAVEYLRRYELDAVMIGRAALGRPWIFAEANALWRAQTPPAPPTPDELGELIKEHFDGLLALERAHPALRRRRQPPERIAVCRIRGHLLHYVRGLPGSTVVRRRLNDLCTPDQLFEAVDFVIGARARSHGTHGGGTANTPTSSNTARSPVD